MMTIQQLKCFRALSSVLNFTEAARAMNMSQSNLSNTIANLEKELGMKLFDRSGSGVCLSNAGRVFLPSAQRCLQAICDGENEIKLMSDPLKGEVTIAYPGSLSNEFLPYLVRRFYKNTLHNDISLRLLSLGTSGNVLENLSDDRADLYFTCAQPQSKAGSHLAIRQSICALMPSGHRLARREAVTLAELSAEPLIFYNKGTMMRKHSDAMFALSGIAPNIAYTAYDLFGMATFVSLGLGISITPRVPNNHPNTVACHIDHPMNYRDIYLAWSSARRLLPVVEYVRNFLIDSFSEIPKDCEDCYIRV